MPRAFILGVSGQIGRAAAGAMLAQGWDVVGASRNDLSDMEQNPRFSHLKLDRNEDEAIEQALADGADILIDCIAFTKRHAAQLLEVQNAVGRICVISSASVYVDEMGRTFDDARESGFPELPIPILESQPTVAPGTTTYSANKVAMEQHLLNEAKVAVNVMRPGAIYGRGSSHAREWYFIKRLLDGRTKIPIAYEANSQFHTTASDNIAAAIMCCAMGDLPPVANIVDPVAPTVGEIAEAIMAVMETKAEIIGLPDRGYPLKAGVTPWSIPRPFVCSVSKAYTSVGTYSELVGSVVTDLIDRVGDRDWRTVLPQLAAYPYDTFDYDYDDRALAE